MSQPNHIIGGTVFTAVFASLWDINIFAHQGYIITTCIASVLPDIDHPKGVGKSLYPISKYISRKYGHRTITHSLPFFIVCVFLVSLFFSSPFTIVFALALSSHFLLDMITIQGIPLFYPFKKNPCVIPGSPDSRLKSGDPRTEIIATLFFLTVGVTCWPLITNGFWLTFNRALGTKKQLINEYKRSEKILYTTYNFKRDFILHQGAGLCLKVNNNQITILDTSSYKLVHIYSTDFTKDFYPAKSDFVSLEDISCKRVMNEFSIQDFNEFTANKTILNADIFTSEEVIFYIDNNPIKGEYLQQDYINSLKIIPRLEEQNTKNRRKLLLQIARLEKSQNKLLKAYNNEIKTRDSLQQIYTQSSDIEKSEIIDRLKKPLPDYPHNSTYKHQIELLKMKLEDHNPKQKKVKVYGSLTYFNL